LKKKCEIIFFKAFEYNVIYISNKPTGNICEKMSFFFSKIRVKKFQIKIPVFWDMQMQTAVISQTPTLIQRGKKEKEKEAGFFELPVCWSLSSACCPSNI
jgi:hypothetical protein